MKVLWVVNSIFPYPAKQLGNEVSCFGGWTHSLYESLKKEEIVFCIAATYDGDDLKKFNDDKTFYYLIPNKKENKYNEELKYYWKQIIEDFNPDIVHIHGTEYPKSLPLVELYPNLNYVVSIQGILKACARSFNCNLPLTELLKNITLRDILKPKTGFLGFIEYKNRAKYEQMLLKNVNNVIGRTTWDKSQVLAINPDINYYHCEENLRECFYDDKWDINKINRHTIFFSQAQAIFKGFYILVEAVKILKRKYPDVQVIVAGNNILNSGIKNKLKRQSYSKYLLKKIREYDLERNIVFTGFLNAEDYKERLIKSNVYVQCSSIENSSNSLGEAMILGVPIVASNVGGTSDMLIDKVEGLLYTYTEPELLAYYIDQLFSNDELCKDISSKAIKHATKRHNWKNNAKTMLEIYNNIKEK